MGQGRADGRDTGPQQLCLPCAGPFRKSVSSCQRLVSGTSCRRRSWGAGASQSRQRRAPGRPVELLVDWARLSGSQPVAQGEVQAEPSRLGRGGGQQEPQLWGSSVSDPQGGCGDSLPTAATMGLTELLTAQERPLAHVDGGASEGPGPLSPPVGRLPSPQALRSSAPRIPPVLRVSGCDVPPWDSASRRNPGGQSGLLQSHPVFHSSLGQPHRSATCVRTCDCFRVINKDSFL